MMPPPLDQSQSSPTAGPSDRSMTHPDQCWPCPRMPLRFSVYAADRPAPLRPMLAHVRIILRCCCCCGGVFTKGLSKPALRCGLVQSAPTPQRTDASDAQRQCLSPRSARGLPQSQLRRPGRRPRFPDPMMTGRGRGGRLLPDPIKHAFERVRRPWPRRSTHSNPRIKNK